MSRPPRTLHEQFASFAFQDHAFRLGMWIFLSSEVMLFGALFTAYAYYRVMYGGEFVSAIGLADFRGGAINTFVLATSSFTMTLCVWSAKKGRSRELTLISLAATIGLAGIFLAIEISEWAHHFARGILPGEHYRYVALHTFGANAYFTLFFLMTGLHGLHVIGGIVILSLLGVRQIRKPFLPDDHTALELGGMFWHFVDVVWAFLWSCLYLAR